jgi:hypothetical protein
MPTLFTLIRSSAVVLPVLSLVGTSSGRRTPVETAPSPVLAGRPLASERLVAEAPIRILHGVPVIFLPVTLHGHKAVIQLTFKDIPQDFFFSKPDLKRLGVDLPADDKNYIQNVDSLHLLDSITIGTRVAHNLSKFVFDDPNIKEYTNELQQPDLPPVIGMAGVAFLADYDIVVDGPAHRIRLYAPLPSSAQPQGSGKELPPGVRAVTCAPTSVLQDGEFSFMLDVAGHPVTGVVTDQYRKNFMNQAAATLVGLTTQSSNVVPISKEDKDGLDQEFGITTEATDMPVTMGQVQLKAQKFHLTQDVPMEPDGTTPTVLLNLGAVLDRVFVLSSSTHQACLGQKQ